MQAIGRRWREQSGFTLIEILVVILIVGVLAAISIPLLLSQKGKANDASAKVQARTAQTAAETYSTDHNGEYKGISLAELQALEPVLKDKVSAQLVKVVEKEGGYVVEAESMATKNRFAIERTKSGQINRTCIAEHAGGCPVSGSW